MTSRNTPMLIALVALSLSALPCNAEDRGASGGTAPIKGADVMGDKNRSGPDGWVQAPVARDEAPAATQKSAGEAVKPPTTTKPSASMPMKPGDDPGSPVDQSGSLPGRAAASHN